MGHVAANFAAVTCPARGIDRLLHCTEQYGVPWVNAGSATFLAYVVAEHRLVRDAFFDDRFLH